MASYLYTVLKSGWTSEFIPLRGFGTRSLTKVHNFEYAIKIGEIMIPMLILYLLNRLRKSTFYKRSADVFIEAFGLLLIVFLLTFSLTTDYHKAFNS